MSIAVQCSNPVQNYAEHICLSGQGSGMLNSALGKKSRVADRSMTAWLGEIGGHQSTMIMKQKPVNGIMVIVIMIMPLSMDSENMERHGGQDLQSM